MPIPEKYIAPFESGAYYHVICKSLPQQKLFLSDENKRFFLERYFHYLSDYLYTYSYILLDNHCHFLVQVKEEEEIVRNIRSVDEDKRTVIQKKFLEENNPSDMIAGNAPLIVNKITGNITYTGTAHPIEHYLKEYEQNIEK